MKATLFAALVAAGIGLAGAAPASAAPVGGVAIGDAAQHLNLTQNAQIYVYQGRRWRHRGRVCERVHFRHSRARRVCHYRYW